MTICSPSWCRWIPPARHQHWTGYANVFTFGQLERLELLANHHDNDIALSGASGLNRLTVRGGGGNDDFALDAITGGVLIALHGEGNADTFNVSGVSGGAVEMWGDPDGIPFGWADRLNLGNGNTDAVMFVHRFSADGSIGEMDCFYSSWATRDPKGFSEENLQALRRLVPALGLAVKSAALARISSTLVEVYLGRDAGQRVLEGRIRRGIADRIEAVVWFSDLRSFTAITDTARPVEGYAAPQLHTHSVIFNVTERENEQTRSLQPRELYASQHFATAIYRAELATRLQQLGYEIERGEHGQPEIKGYSREYLEASSPRRQ